MVRTEIDSCITGSFIVSFLNLEAYIQCNLNFFDVVFFRMTLLNKNGIQ